MNAASWRGHTSYPSYSTSGLSLQPKPSKHGANTRREAASAGTVYRLRTPASTVDSQSAD